VSVQIRLFAVARELAEAEIVALDIRQPCTIGQLRARLAAQVPALAAVLPHVLFAIGSQYAAEDTIVPDGAEVACIPPVSGG
jgi:molybdopterin synthase sulfur carrier subunit